MPPTNNDMLRTVADELLDLVKKSKKISVGEAANKLKVPVANIQSIVDFLVEEKVFGMEYKFTTPYIYMYGEGVKGKDKGFAEGLITKGQFYQKAKEKNVPHEQITHMWKKYLQQNLVHIREEFLKKAKDKKTREDKIEEIWNEYLTYL